MARILVIDDDAQLLQMVGMMLERGGHEAILVNDPLQGMDRIREEKPDLLILDVMMPTMSGHDLAEQIRANDDVAGMPILILTARSQPIDREAALESGADDYMSKPVMPQELMERIDNLLAREGVREGEREGLVISLFGMRGGVGRTTLATNLAAGLRRTSQKEVCLVDLSPSGGQVVLHLRLQPRSTWARLPSLSQLEWGSLKEHLLIHQSGLRVLAAPKQPQLPIAPSGEVITAVLELLRQHVSFVVLDLPTSFNPAVQAALELSDMVLHVVTPEVVTVQVALQATNTLHRSEINLKQHGFILNQVTPENQLPSTAVEKGLKARLAFKIGYDSHQSRALAQGVPLALTPSQSPLPAGVRRMAQVLRKRLEEPG